MMTFDEAVAADTLGILLPEELPEVATRALCSGLDSPCLAALAGESPRANSAYELHGMFEDALRELRIKRPTPLEAARALRNYYARRVVAREVSPRFGAEAIVRGILERVRHSLPTSQYLGEGLGIARLVGLFWDYDLVDHEGLGSEEEIDAAVIDECRRILERPAA